MKTSLRILVVEDEMMVAMLIEDMLEVLGHEVVGPAHRVDSGLELAEREQLDLAVLDVDLAGAKSFPIPDRLLSRDVPFTFATGYGASGVGERYPRASVIAKPFTLAALSDAFSRGARPAKRNRCGFQLRSLTPVLSTPRPCGEWQKQSAAPRKRYAGPCPA